MRIFVVKLIFSLLFRRLYKKITQRFEMTFMEICTIFLVTLLYIQSNKFDRVEKKKNTN